MNVGAPWPTLKEAEARVVGIQAKLHRRANPPAWARGEPGAGTTGTPGSEVRAGETDRPRGRHRAPARPYYYTPERDFAVWLCNAHHVKNVPGRKTDMSDAEWLADVAAHGMVRPSFVPPPPIRELRELTRYRKTQIDARVAEIQRLEKVLQDAGIKLTSVASKVLTQSGRAMVKALIAGERDPGRLAALAKGKLRPRIAELTEALAGHFGSHHAVAARRILDHLDYLEATVTALTEQIDARTRPYAAVFELLLPVPGLDRLTIDVVIAETGADMDHFPSPAQLASWAGLCPGNHESAGKRRRVGTPPGNQWLRRALIEAAHAAARTKGTYFAAQYRQIARRRGPNKAAVAVAHSLLDLIWHLLRTGSASRTWATTSSTAAATRRARPAVWSTSSNNWATPSPSPPPPHSCPAPRRVVGRRPTR